MHLDTSGCICFFIYVFSIITVNFIRPPNLLSPLKIPLLFYLQMLGFMGVIDKGYLGVLESLKIKIRTSRQKVAIAVNTQLLTLYWEIGNTISQQQKLEGWGTQVVEKLAQDLKMEFPDFKGLSARNLWYMKSFADAWPRNSILQQLVAELQSSDNQYFEFIEPLVAQIPWGQHIVLLNKTKTGDERLFYLKKTVENGWSRSVLTAQIESQLHLRQGKAINNFDSTLPKPHSDLARETLKNPYMFDFLGIEEEIQERELEKALMQHIKKFTLELGRGFAYVGNQYNLTVEDDDYFLDLLFYNYHLHCFVVFELKVSNFRPEYAGKLNFYINTINEKIKGENDLPTIGVLLCKTPNETVVKYSLLNINAPIGIAGYEFTKALPKKLKGGMPTIEELEQELKREVGGFKEQVNPVNARLQAIKERLKHKSQNDIQTLVTYSALIKLYTKCLRFLYEEIIKQLGVFDEDFCSKSFNWKADMFDAYRIERLDVLWKNQTRLLKLKKIRFNYSLLGFKKAGIDCLDDHSSLIFEIHDYWYDFTLKNHNDDQPFLKKLYHQTLDKKEMQTIIDLMMSKILDRMELYLERIG
jgi:predicted nuclease of restriction endonuclease-like (RecB) superfamily